MGHRMSSLPIAQYCAQGPVLGQLGASRAAAISTCFHARCAGDERWREMYARLDPKEQEELDRMQAPTRLDLPTFPEGGVLDTHKTRVHLAYVDAYKEQPLGLDADLCYVPHSDPTAITSGTADGYWVVSIPGGWTFVVVMDIKRSQWTSSADSLQLHAYATAICGLLASRGIVVDAYQTAIWAATEGVWEVGRLLTLDSPEIDDIRARILAAARHAGTDYSMGRHCRGCYGRSNCPAYLMAPESADATLSRFFAAPLTQDTALELLGLTERAEKTVEKAREMLKTYVTQVGQIVDGDSVYKKVPTRGRVGLDSKALERDHPELVRQYLKIGADYDQIRWTGKKRG